MWSASLVSELAVIAVVVSLFALTVSGLAYMHASGMARRLAHIDALIEAGITRDDLDKLHHRINVLVEKVGKLDAGQASLSAQFARIDTYLRKDS
jgi:hypothetical protein